jgi:hypothetical protein
MRDRLIGILLGILLGIAIVLLFLFLGSRSTIDEPGVDTATLPSQTVQTAPTSTGPPLTRPAP